MFGCVGWEVKLCRELVEFLLSNALGSPVRPRSIAQVSPTVNTCTQGGGGGGGGIGESCEPHSKPQHLTQPASPPPPRHVDPKAAATVAFHFASLLHRSLTIPPSPLAHTFFSSFLNLCHGPRPFFCAAGVVAAAAKLSKTDSERRQQRQLRQITHSQNAECSGKSYYAHQPTLGAGGPAACVIGSAASLAAAEGPTAAAAALTAGAPPASPCTASLGGTAAPSAADGGAAPTCICGTRGSAAAVAAGGAPMPAGPWVAGGATASAGAGAAGDGVGVGATAGGATPPAGISGSPTNTGGSAAAAAGAGVGAAACNQGSAQHGMQCRAVARSSAPMGTHRIELVAHSHWQPACLRY